MMRRSAALGALVLMVAGLAPVSKAEPAITISAGPKLAGSIKIPVVEGELRFGQP